MYDGYVNRIYAGCVNRIYAGCVNVFILNLIVLCFSCHSTVTKAGPLYGLILELNVQQEDYIPLTSTAGFKVIIHNFYEPPFPEDTGILVRPGDVTSIALKKVTPRISCTTRTGDRS